MEEAGHPSVGLKNQDPQVREEALKTLRAALRWHARYCAEVEDVGFEEAHAVLACLAGLAGWATEARSSRPGRVVRRRGLERASEALVRWVS